MRTIFTENALQDLDEAIRYLDDLNPRAADLTFEAISEFCNKTLAKHPFIGHQRPDLPEGLRSFTIRNYVVIYEVLSAEVSILRIIYGMRDLTLLGFH